MRQMQTLDKDLSNALREVGLPTLALRAEEGGFGHRDDLLSELKAYAAVSPVAENFHRLLARVRGGDFDAAFGQPVTEQPLSALMHELADERDAFERDAHSTGEELRLLRHRVAELETELSHTRRVRLREPEARTCAWWREWSDGRIEVVCKTDGYRLRFFGPEEEAWRHVELFEAATGLTVHAERRPRRKPPVPENQVSMFEVGSDDG